MLKIYKASAGSGKTFTLTREYIKFLIARKGEDGIYRLRKNPRGAHRHILAITYTNKATEEMTRRIIHELSLLSRTDLPDGSGSQYKEEFIALLKCPEAELAEAARIALYDLLSDYNYFNVSTIDAFFQSVLRIFTREVEVPDNFEVELDNNYTISLGVSEMFNSINYREPAEPILKKERQWLTNWLTNYMRALMDSGKAFNLFSKASYIHNDIVGTFSALMDETFKLNLPAMQEYFSDRQRIIKFDASMTADINGLFAELKEKSLRVNRLIDPSEMYVHLRNPMLRWIDGDMYRPGGTTVTDAVTDIRKRYCAACIKAGNIPADTDEAVIDMCRTAVALFERQDTYGRIQATIYQLGLLGALISYIDRYCRDNNMLLLSETNSLLREIINDDETPFIYEKLGYYLDHFLIDEFQDTSPMQWDNLRPLVMESLSRGNDNLVIGDEKQCIYRFRNSDPELLSRHVGQQIAARFTDANVSTRGTDISENNNWRSAPEVVMFNNSLFHSLAGIVDGERTGAASGTISASATYGNIVQQVPPNRSGRHGYVKLHFVPDKNQQPGECDDEQADATGYALDFMTAEITRQLTVGGYAPRDIAVLVRSHSHGEAVINHLLHEMERPGSRLPRFEIMSNDAMTVSSSPTVRLIISILRLVNTPEFLDGVEKRENLTDTKARTNPAHRRARLINRYEYYMHMTHNGSDGTVRPYTPSEALAAALDENDTLADTEGIAENLSAMLTMSCPNLPSIVERIINRCIPAGARADDNIFLNAFQDIVLDYCSRGDNDIRAFLAWWDKSGCRTALSSPPDMNALTVMTIHQSKGLEFPCVHIPFATGDLMKYIGYSWFRLNRGDFPGIEPECIPPIVPLAVSPKLSSIPAFSDDFNDYCHHQRIDELNVNYVAFTRATTELIVCSDTEKGKSGERFGPYLKAAIESMTADYIDSDSCPLDATRRRWVMPLSRHFDGQTLTIGAPTVKPRQQEAAGGKKQGPEKILMPEYKSSDNSHLTGRTRTDTLETFDLSIPRHLGNFMHDVMSRVRHSADLDTAIERQSYRYGVTDADRLRLADRLRRAIESVKEMGWFDGFSRVITERPVSERIKLRRPDRVVWTSGGTVDIIDYKFGETPPSDDSGETSRQHRRYAAQVKEYAGLLHEAGHSGVRGYVWYISDSLIQHIRVV